MPKLSGEDFFVFATHTEHGRIYTGGDDTPPQADLLEAAKRGEYVWICGLVRHALGSELPPEHVELFVRDNTSEIVKKIGERQADVVNLLGAACFDAYETTFPKAWPQQPASVLGQPQAAAIAA
jgi:hypothetical protein